MCPSADEVNGAIYAPLFVGKKERDVEKQDYLVTQGTNDKLY
jgi:hypothetical protein